jgi:hypothetical protein
MPLVTIDTDHPAFKAVLAYTSKAPAFDPGEGDWNGSESAFHCGAEQERYTAAAKMRALITAAGVSAPRGKDELVLEAEDGSWKWFESDVQAADNAAWLLDQQGCDSYVIAANSGGFYPSDAAADNHVRDAADNHADPAYRDLCRRALAIVEATAEQDEEEPVA